MPIGTSFGKDNYTYKIVDWTLTIATSIFIGFIMAIGWISMTPVLSWQ